MSFFRIIALSPVLSFVFFSIIGSLSIHAKTLVSTEEASQLLMNPARSSPAVVVSLNQGIIPAQTTGVISELIASVGEAYIQGDILAKLDCVDNEFRQQTENAKVSQATIQLLFSQRELIRGEKLAKQKNIGEAELDRLSSAVKTADSLLNAQKSVLNMAELNVERCDIKAPYNGIVTKRIVSVGEMIEYGKPVVEMIEVAALEVSAKIANSDEASFNNAQSFILDAGGEEYKVILRTLLPIIETNSRSREARFIFSDQKALVGSTGRLRWQSPISYLPAHLLLKRNGSNGYFIVANEDGINIAKFIAVNSAEEGRPVPFSGTAETKIITDGRHGLNDGDQIELAKQNIGSHGDKF